MYEFYACYCLFSCWFSEELLHYSDAICDQILCEFLIVGEMCARFVLET